MSEGSVPTAKPLHTHDVVGVYLMALNRHLISTVADIVGSYAGPSCEVVHSGNLLKGYTDNQFVISDRYGNEIGAEIDTVPAESPNNIAKYLANGELILEVLDIPNYCGIQLWSGLYISFQYEVDDLMTSTPVDGISHVKFMETLYDVQRVMFKGLVIIHHSDGTLTSHVCPSQYPWESEMCYPPDALIPKGMTPLAVLYNNAAGIALLPNGRVATFGVASSGGFPYDDSKFKELGEVVNVHPSYKTFLVEHANGFHLHASEPMRDDDSKHFQTGIKAAWDTAHSWLALCTDGRHIGFGTGHCAVIPAEIQLILDRVEYNSIIGVDKTFIVLLQDGTLRQWGENALYYCDADAEVADADAEVADTLSVAKYEQIELHIDALGKRYCLAYKLRDEADKANPEDDYDVFT